MNRFDEAYTTTEKYDMRLQANTLRVKILHWFTPKLEDENGNRLVFDANQVMSRLGNSAFRRAIRNDPEAELALVADMQGLYYKSAVGLLAIGNEIEPVRLETINIDAETGLPMVQHALIYTRMDSEGATQVKFR